MDARPTDASVVSTPDEGATTIASSEPTTYVMAKPVKPLMAFALAFALGVGFTMLVDHAQTSRLAPAHAADVSEELATVDSPADSVDEADRGDWPLVRGDALGSGVVCGGLPKDLKLLWKYTVKDGSFAAAAVIADGTVFVGDLDGTFYAIDLANGEEKWKKKVAISITASAAVRDGRAYVADADGQFHCFDAATGDVLWTYKTESGAEINSSPNFYKDNVLFGSQDSTLYCLSAKTGDVVWKYAIEDQIRCSPTIVGNRTFLAGCDSKLHVIDLDAGKSVAEVDIQSQTGSTPAVLGDRVYFGTEGGTFYAVDWRTANVVWTFANDANMQAIRASAAVTPDAVIVGGHDKRVRAFNPETGDVLWTFTTKGQVDSSPIVAGDRVYFGSYDGRIYGLNRKTGKEVWPRYEAGGRFSAAPAAARGRLVIGNESGELFCFGEK